MLKAYKVCDKEDEGTLLAARHLLLISACLIRRFPTRVVRCISSICVTLQISHSRLLQHAQHPCSSTICLSTGQLDHWYTILKSPEA